MVGVLDVDNVTDSQSEYILVVSVSDGENVSNNNGRKWKTNCCRFSEMYDTPGWWAGSNLHVLLSKKIL